MFSFSNGLGTTFLFDDIFFIVFLQGANGDYPSSGNPAKGNWESQ
jgi:hypothetical protein